METQAKFALTPVAGAITAALYPSIQAIAQDDVEDEGFLDEIIVTSTKREMNVQDIPATIQAITSETLKQMGAKSMEDYARFIPSVNVVNFTNGSATIVFRGAITGSGFIAQSTSSLYLDEMSVTNTGSQPQIRTIDIERVEALSGPQGTLYGSDAQAGTMRVVTNKPVMNEFEAIVDLELRNNSPGEESYRSSLVLNIPLVEDKLAARLVGFSDRDGGFVDNVFGHTPDTIVNPDFAPAFGQQVWPSEWGTLDNAGVVEEDWNESEVYGGRLQLRWDISDNFSATLSTMHQVTDTGAYNDYDPNVGDLQTIRFHDEWRYDEFNIHSLVLEADLGFAQLVSATGYYERDIESLWDITVYAHYFAAQYCQDTYYTLDLALYEADPAGMGGNVIYMNPAIYGHYWTNPDSGRLVFFPRYCQGQTLDADFFSAFYEPASQRKFTQEIRLSSEGERFDWILGFYYEESADRFEDPFAEPTTGGRGEVNTFDGSVSQRYFEHYWSLYYGTPTTFPGRQMAWYSQNHTDWEQKAVFGELKWHINEEFTLTLGGRYFERESNQFYLVNHPGGLPLGPGQAPVGEPDYEDPINRPIRLANNGLPAGRFSDETEFIPKISLSWAFNDDQMVYGLFTRGKRPGGINRVRGEPFFPGTYEPDTMDNLEFGYKSTFGNGRGRLNVTAYQMEWSEYQLEITDPSGDTGCEDLGLPDASIPGVCGQPWQQVVTNAGDAHINGVMVELDYAPSDQLTLGMNAEFMEAETDTEADLTGNGESDLVAGLQLPNVPDYTASVWGQYNWPVDLFGAGNSAYVRAQWSFTGDSFNILQDTEFANPRTLNEGYDIGDLRFGIQGDSWDVSLFVNNVTDERATYTVNTGQFEHAFANLAEGRGEIARNYTNRPREYGIRYSMRWGD
jgi:outer membrane receptor protein involved in Fe transport